MHAEFIRYAYITKTPLQSRQADLVDRAEHYLRVFGIITTLLAFWIYLRAI
jgi:hypothetical protein